LDRTYNSGVSGDADTVFDWSFTRILIGGAITFPRRCFAAQDYQNYNPAKKGEPLNGSLSFGAYDHGTAGSAARSIAVA
jgi:hypothetical protein